jgi:hypothetical protein
MKRILLIICACVSQIISKAQITNGGFETLNPSNMPIHWVPKFYIFPVLIDSLGLPTADSVVFDGFMSKININNPHSGNNAYEMRSGYNFTKKEGFSSGVRLMGDSSTMGFFAGGFPYQPSLNKLQFYYRFESEMNDTAFASFAIYDENEEEIFKADFDLTVYESGYKEINKTIEYPSSKPASYAVLYFLTCKPESEPHLGSRLLIDDVNLSSVNFIQETSIGGIRFYPNPIKNKLFIESINGENFDKISVFNLEGALVLSSSNTEEVDLSNLNSGVYFIKIQNNHITFTKKLIKE